MGPIKRRNDRALGEQIVRDQDCPGPDCPGPNEKSRVSSQEKISATVAIQWSEECPEQLVLDSRHKKRRLATKWIILVCRAAEMRRKSWMVFETTSPCCVHSWRPEAIGDCRNSTLVRRTETIQNEGSRALIIEQTSRGPYSAVSKPVQKSRKKIRDRRDLGSFLSLTRTFIVDIDR